jgi:hypothetical protein
MTAVLQVSYPAFVMLDTPTQNRRVAAWSRVLAGLSATGTISAIQVVEQVVPDQGRGVVGWWEDHGIHNGSWAAREYEVLMREAVPASSAHRTFISIVLDMKKAKRQINSAGRGVTGAAKVLGEDMATIRRGLEGVGLTIERWLSPGELGDVIRQAYDPAYDDVAGLGAAAASNGPAAVQETWEWMRHDSAFSQVLWVSNWPSVESVPNFLHALIFCQGVRRTLTLFARPIGLAEAMEELKREKASYAVDRKQKLEHGQIESAFDLQEELDVLERERALVKGHADMRFTGFITITAPSEEQLKSDVALVQRAAASAMVETRVLFGQQSQAFVAGALPLGRTVA